MSADFSVINLSDVADSESYKGTLNIPTCVALWVSDDSSQAILPSIYVTDVMVVVDGVNGNFKEITQWALENGWTFSSNDELVE
jgi:hypothetical protein